MSVYTGLNGFAGNLRRRNQSFDQTFRSHFHFHPPHTVSCWKVTFWQKWKQKFKKTILTKLDVFENKGRHLSTKVHFLKHSSRSRLEAREWRQKFSISSRSMRPKGRNSRSRLETWDWREEILDLVSKHETERKKFSISSRELKLASRYALPLTHFLLKDDILSFAQLYKV